MNIGMILAGGSGKRFGGDLPKQYHQINGKMVISYVVDALEKAKSIDKIVFVGDLEEPHLAELVDRYGGYGAYGGKTRNQSLDNGLRYIWGNLKCEYIILLDAVRPMVYPELIDQYISLLEDGYDCVSTVQEITDSLGSRDFWQVDRSRYYLMQSPEAYRFDLLYQWFDKESIYTEVLHQLPEDTRAYFNFGFTNNLKLTYNWELKYLSELLGNRP